MLCDPLAHLLGDGLDRAILKGNLQPGGLHQLRVAGQTGTAHQLEVAFPGILVVLEAQQEELQRSHGGQAVINIVEGALIDVELTLPAGTAAIEGQVVEIDPGAVLVLQLQPDGVALVRGEVGVLVHPVLELVHDAAIGQEEEAVLGVEQGVFLSVLTKEQMVPGSRQELHGHGMDLGALHAGALEVCGAQSYETLCKVKELDPEIETGYILALGVGTYYDLPAADFFSVESTFITSGMVQQLHLRGKTVSAWTVNRAEDARDLLSLGVDDVITDKPEMVQDLLNEDADLDRNLVLMRDRLKELLGLTESADSEVDPDDSAIEEVLEDPEELLDQA